MLASTTLMVPERHLTRIQGLNQALQGGQMIVTAPLGALLIAVAIFRSDGLVSLAQPAVQSLRRFRPRRG